MKKHQKTLIKFSSVFVFAAALIMIGWKLFANPEQLRSGIEFIRSFGSLSIFIFVLIYIGLASLSVPSTPFNLAAGIIFGFWSGLGAAVIGALGAACVGFLLARFLFHDFMMKQIEKTESGNQILSIVESESPKIIAILRLNPFIPAFLKSYGLGITDVKFTTYVWATLLGQFPITCTYVYAGYIGGQAMLSEEGGPDALHYSILGVGIVLSAFLVFYTRYYFKKLDKA